MNPLRTFLRGALAVFFVVAGANHFRMPGIYLGMMPRWLPWPAYSASSRARWKSSADSGS